MNVQMITSYALSVGSDMKYQAFSGDAWAKAAEVTLLGMGMVFSVLAILWGVLAIFKLVFAREKKPAKANEVKAEALKVAEPAPVAVEAVADDSELIAVITAAVAAYRASEEGMTAAEAGGFRVVSFKRAGTGRAWNSNK